MWFENEWVRKIIMVIAIFPLLLIGASLRRDAKLKEGNERSGRQLQVLAGVNLVLLIIGDSLSETMGIASYWYALMLVCLLDLLFFGLRAYFLQKNNKKKS